jgi:hypothetical protein
MWDTMSGAAGAADRPSVRQGSKAAYVGEVCLGQARMPQPGASAAPPRMASLDRDQGYSEQHQRHVPGYAHKLHGGVRQAAAGGAGRSQWHQLSVRASALANDAPAWRLGRRGRAAHKRRGPQGDGKGATQLLKPKQHRLRPNRRVHMTTTAVALPHELEQPLERRGIGRNVEERGGRGSSVNRVQLYQAHAHLYRP